MLPAILSAVPEWAYATLRWLFLLSTVFGHILALFCYFDARREWNAHRAWESVPGHVDLLAELLTHGQMLDMGRLALAQLFLTIAALVAILIASLAGSGYGAFVLLPLLPASLVLTWKTYRQYRRRIYAMQLAGTRDNNESNKTP